MKIIVTGGGVIGCSIAYNLTKAGADVTLLERGEVAGEASGAAAGLIIPPDRAAPPGPFRDACLASLALYPALIEAIERESGVNVQGTASGILVVTQVKDRVAVLQAYARVQQRNGVNTEWVDGDALRALEPALSPRILGAAHSPDERHVNPALVTKALAGAAAAAGAEIRERTMLTGFVSRSGCVQGVTTNARDSISADAVVLAAGPWTGTLTKRLGATMPTPPRRGQMLAYRSTELRHAIWGDDGYLVPKGGGIVYAGATVEDVGFRKMTTDRGLAGLRRMAAALMPSLRHAEVASAWAGLRPGSPDDLPIMGRVPGRENVYIATGHFRNGILLAPITGQLMSQLILEDRTEMPLEAFTPSRFG